MPPVDISELIEVLEDTSTELPRFVMVYKRIVSKRADTIITHIRRGCYYMYEAADILRDNEKVLEEEDEKVVRELIAKGQLLQEQLQYVRDGCDIMILQAPSETSFLNIFSNIKRHMQERELCTNSEVFENRCKKYFGEVKRTSHDAAEKLYLATKTNGPSTVNSDRESLASTSTLSLVGDK